MRPQINLLHDSETLSLVRMSLIEFDFIVQFLQATNCVVSGVTRYPKIRSPLSGRCEEMIARWHSGESSHPDRELLAAECPKIPKAKLL